MRSRRAEVGAAMAMALSAVLVAACSADRGAGAGQADASGPPDTVDAGSGPGGALEDASAGAIDAASADAAPADAALVDAGVPDAAPPPPDTYLLSAGPPAQPLSYATFEFEASDPGASFLCSLDGVPPQPCSSPISYTYLETGEHVFTVAAEVGGIGDPSPATYSWIRDDGGYQTLSDTGLYQDIASKTIAPAVIAYQPTYPLWSDGAVKHRWVRLPPGLPIDTSNMDQWEFPVGTQIWKEFVSPDGKRIETRLIERRTSGGYPGWDDYALLATFVWRADESDADYDPDGAYNVRGTIYDVPPVNDCIKCHRGQPGLVLGLSAVQMARPGSDGDLTLQDLWDAGLLTDRPLDPGVGIPGSTVARRALGFLHANCSHCHNPGGWLSVIPMDLRTLYGQQSVEETPAYQTTVGRDLALVVTGWTPPPDITKRIDPGASATSAIYFRASSRGPSDDGQRADQMPPVATELVPEEWVSNLASWIDSL